MNQLIAATKVPQATWGLFVAKLGAMDDFLLFNLLTNAVYEYRIRPCSTLCCLSVTISAYQYRIRIPAGVLYGAFFSELHPLSLTLFKSPCFKNL